MKSGLRTIEFTSYGGVTDVLSDLATKAVASRPADCQFGLLADRADACIATCQELGLAQLARACRWVIFW